MRIGKIVSNATNFPYAKSMDVRGLITFKISKVRTFAGSTPKFIPIPLFAPAFINSGYTKLLNHINPVETTSGLPFGIAATSGQFPGIGGTFPLPPVSFQYQTASGLPVFIISFDTKELAYMEMQNMLLGGDLLRITNIRLRYQLKIPSANMRNQVITFFSQNIFGQPDFQELTIGQYFDPVNNKTSNSDAPVFESIDIPVDFFASNTSGICLNVDPQIQVVLSTLSATFQVEKYFNHVEQNKKIL